MIDPSVVKFLLSYCKTVNNLQRSWINVDTASCQTARNNSIIINIYIYIYLCVCVVKEPQYIS